MLFSILKVNYTHNYDGSESRKRLKGHILVLVNVVVVGELCHRDCHGTAAQ